MTAARYLTELQLALDVVREACHLARQVQDRVVATGAAHAKSDRSPVTIADLAVQALVSHRLADAYPGDALLAEEEAQTLVASPALAAQVIGLVRQQVADLDLGRLSELLDRGRSGSGPGERRWVLDPIDGTKGFLRGEQYAVALALLVAGRVEVGVLGCPALATADGGTGCLFSAVRGGGAQVHTLAEGEPPAPIAVDLVSDPSLAVLCESVEAAHAAHDDHHAIARRLGITSPSLRIDSQCKYAVVARGDASVYLRLPRRADYREKAWDHAAGALLIEEAGGRVSDLDGRSLDFSAGRELARHRGIVATNGRLHAQVLDACREVLGLR